MNVCRHTFFIILIIFNLQLLYRSWLKEETHRIHRPLTNIELKFKIIYRFCLLKLFVVTGDFEVLSVTFLLEELAKCVEMNIKNCKYVLNLYIA